MTISFVVPGTAIAQPRHRVGAGIHGGRPRAYLPSDHPVHAFKQVVQIVARQAYHGDPLEGPIRVDLLFLMPRPKRMMWAKRPMPREWHTAKPDAENVSKSLCDALTGIVWVDDAQIAMLVLKKQYASGHEEPCVCVTVEAI